MNTGSFEVDDSRGNKRLFHFRPESSGDRGVIEQVFKHRDYAHGSFARSAALQRWLEALPAGRPPLILDLGANIGASVLWFAMAFPGAQIVAVEPEPNNFALLARNTDGLRARLVQGAVNDGMPAYLVDPGYSDWAFRVQPQQAPGAALVPSYSVPQLLRDAKDCAPFLCKIDIEGSEAEVFNDPIESGWLNEFPLVVIELHDWMMPGKAVSRNFLRAISTYHFDVVQRGENLWCFNNALLGSI